MNNNLIRWQVERHEGAKYRASCDACNEAKVRCSRTKPTCDRCQKSQIICLYGLSRRSHKTAARIGQSQPTAQQQQQHQQQQEERQQKEHQQKQQREQSESAQRQQHQQHMESTFSSIGSATTSEGTPFSGSSSSTGNHSTPSLSVDFSDILNFDMSTSESPAPLHLDPALQDSKPLDINEFGLVFPTCDPIVDPTFPKSILGSIDTPGKERDFMSSAAASGGPGFLDFDQSCSSRIVHTMAATPLLLAKKRFSLDVQLSQLKSATNFAEECLDADNAEWDEMSPLAVSMLIGSIIAGFEICLEEMEGARDQQQQHSAAIAATHGMSNGGGSSSPPSSFMSQPQFQWGALQIDNEGELALLKRHMWQIQFQRVDAVLQALHGRIKQMRHEQMDQATAQKILAANNFHLWLEQRAQIVKRKFASNVA